MDYAGGAPCCGLLSSPFAFFNILVKQPGNIRARVKPTSSAGHDKGPNVVALASLSALRLRITLIGGGALVIALFVGGGLAGGMTPPIQTLVFGMREVLKGNLDQRLHVARGDGIGFLAQSFDEMVEGLAEKKRIRDTFGRFVSRSVAEAVLENTGVLRGEKRDVCILFQDIRGFTTMSERTDPAALLNMLNLF